MNEKQNLCSAGSFPPFAESIMPFPAMDSAKGIYARAVLGVNSLNRFFLPLVVFTGYSIMFDALRRLTGLIDVREEGDFIHLSGLPGTLVQDDIVKVWGSKKIGTLMFNKMGTSEVVFHRFFAPDVVTTFTRIINTNNKKYQIRALKRVVKLLYENTYLKNTLLEHPSILDYGQLSKFHWKPLEHQTEFLEIYNKNVPRFGLTGYLLGAPPGSGKTLLGLMLMACLRRDTVVIVCPKSAVHKVWSSTLNSAFRTPPKFWTSLDNTPPPPHMQYYVVHYDALDRFLQAAHAISFGHAGVLLDESHKLNEIDTFRTQVFIDMCQKHLKSQHVIWASGTPIKAVGAEATPIFATIDPTFNTPDVQERFRKIYGASAHEANAILNARMGKMHFTIPKSRFRPEVPHTEEVHVKIPNGEKYTLKALRKEMQDFIAERVMFYQKNMRLYRDKFHDILDTFEDQAKDPKVIQGLKLYRKYVKTITATSNLQEIKAEIKYCHQFEKKVILPALSKEDKEAFKDAKSVVKYYLLKVQGEALGRVLGSKRAECVVDMIPHMGLPNLIDHSLSKTLIFTSYVKAVDAAYGFLKGEGYQPLRVYGETNHDLPAIVTKFGEDENANPLLATYKTLAEAVPITMASTLITLNSPFRDYELEQAVARIDRIGQEEPVSVYHVFLDTGEEPNISTRSKMILEWSRNQVSEIMGVNLEDGIIMEQYHERFVPSLEGVKLADIDVQFLDWESLEYEDLYVPVRGTMVSLRNWK